MLPECPAACCHSYPTPAAFRVENGDAFGGVGLDVLGLPGMLRVMLLEYAWVR